MHTKKLLFSAALLAPALLALDWPGSKVRFGPADGSSVVKTFEVKGDFTLDNMTMTMNGQEMPSMEIDMTVNSNQKMVVTDDYVAANSDGSPKKLKRRFDELTNDTAVSFKMEMMGQSQNNDKTVKSKSELLGKSVVFSWDDEAKAYKKVFDPAEGDAELLKNLEEDMDLRVLLPQGDVKAGDEWDIDVKSLVSVLAPGGNMAFVPEESDGDGMGMGGMPGMGSMSDWLSELLEGEAKGKYEGERDVAGQKFAAIHVTIKIKSSKDITELVTEQMKKGKTPPGVDSMDFDSMDIEFELEGDCELLWDLAKGRAHSFEMSGPAHVNMDMAMKLSAQGQNLNLEQSMRMSGTSNMSVKFD